MKISYIFFLSILVFSYQNCTSEHTTTHLSSAQGSESALSQGSLEVFKKNIFPIISQNCQSCHGNGQSPMFALQEPGLALEALIHFGLLSRTTPSSSRLVQKLASGHQGFSNSLATTMEISIQNWSDQLKQIEEESGSPIDAPLPPKLEAKFSSIHKLILIPKCVGCHSATGERPQEDYSTYEKTISTGKIKVGDHNDSGLYSECQSGEMPLNTTALTNEELNILKDWINAGALNN